MGRITTGTGLVSGINSRDIIDQLMKIEQQPKDILQTRVDSAHKQRPPHPAPPPPPRPVKVFGQPLQKPQAFGPPGPPSRDGGVMTATASTGAAVGSFQFQ